MATRQMHLVGYLIAGPTWHNNGAWRHPESAADLALDPRRYERIAQILEEGKFDALFFVDVLTLFDTYQGGFAGQVAGPGQMWFLDPLLLLAAMARKTRHIGLAATLSTTFYHPFHIARAFATLDHISGGRAAWNVVTSANSREAQNFGLDKLMDRNDRYDHADEVMEACDALWNSWDADAIVYDRKRGIYADPSKVHYADYQGKWVRTRGPLPTPRSPQGRPVIMQAGSSKRGRQFAARWAEVIFTLQHSKPDMQAFYTDTTSRRACSSPAAARTSASSHRQSTLCWARPNRSPGSGPSISTAWSAPRSACAISRTLSASIYRNTPSTSDWTIWISLTVREASWTWSCKEPAPVI